MVTAKSFLTEHGICNGNVSKFADKISEVTGIAHANIYGNTLSNSFSQGTMSQLNMERIEKGIEVCTPDDLGSKAVIEVINLFRQHFGYLAKSAELGEVKPVHLSPTSATSSDGAPPDVERNTTKGGIAAPLPDARICGDGSPFTGTGHLGAYVLTAQEALGRSADTPNCAYFTSESDAGLGYNNRLQHNPKPTSGDVALYVMAVELRVTELSQDQSVIQAWKEHMKRKLEKFGLATEAEAKKDSGASAVIPPNQRDSLGGRGGPSQGANAGTSGAVPGVATLVAKPAEATPVETPAPTVAPVAEKPPAPCPAASSANLKLVGQFAAGEGFAAKVAQLADAHGVTLRPATVAALLTDYAASHGKPKSDPK